MRKKSLFETSLMRSKIKTPTVSLFPETAMGYFLGPFLALISNGVVNIWLIQYWDKVLGLGTWAPLFETLMPIISSIVIIIGNIFVGRLMERKPSIAGKARPLLLIGMPVIAAALLILFLVPFPGAAREFLPTEEATFDGGLMASIFIAVGYNLYFAFAWPLYFTSHSALVNLSTRDSKKRGLLSTAVMAAMLGAAGVSGMFGGILVDAFGLLPVYTYSDAYIASHGLGDVTFTNDYSEVANLVRGTDYNITITRAQANQKWVILMIIMIVALIIGCLLEYYFTRERITEENIKNAESVSQSENEKTAVKKVSMSKQMKICIKDKYWWMIMVFWFLYQIGGQMKNNAMSFYSQALTGGNTVSSIINIAGAIPTALGMLIAWPLANKLSKAKAISLGGVAAALAASAAFSALAFVGNTPAVTGISVASFCIKALGTAPAMYVSLALMANVLDHQEAIHSVRTDGFTMAVYGSLIVALPGICNGIIVGLKSAVPVSGQAVLQTSLAYGVEGICYVIIAVMFIFMGVEKFTKVDNVAIVSDQKAEVLARGGKWIDPKERMKLEEEESDKEAEEARIKQLKASCEKKGLDFEAENNKYLSMKAEKEKLSKDKKAKKEADKKAKFAALPLEKQTAINHKKEVAEAKQKESDLEALIELNKIREANNKPAVTLE